MGSYASYDVNEFQSQILPFNCHMSMSMEKLREALQGFPGYSPANTVDKSRSNIGFYGDARTQCNRKIACIRAFGIVILEKPLIINWQLDTVF